MANQRTPAEMRGRAHSIRIAVANIVDSGDEEVVALRANLLAGADALDRLADVVEYTERQMGPPATDWEHDPAKILQTVARIARGENFPDFSERG